MNIFKYILPSPRKNAIETNRNFRKNQAHNSQGWHHILLGHRCTPTSPSRGNILCLAPLLLPWYSANTNSKPPKVSSYTFHDYFNDFFYCLKSQPSQRQVSIRGSTLREITYLLGKSFSETSVRGDIHSPFLAKFHYIKKSVHKTWSREGQHRCSYFQWCWTGVNA